MIAPQKKDAIRVGQLEGKEKAQNLHWLRSAIDVVAEKDEISLSVLRVYDEVLVDVVNVAKVAVNVAEDHHVWLHIHYNHFLKRR